MQDKKNSRDCFDNAMTEFLSAKEAYRPRTYCSRACANRGRVIRGGVADG